ncbi:MAG: PfkB family carbohydrate kinase [Alphaproteobacteria bacterium]
MPSANGHHKKPFRILTSDLLITDISKELKKNPKLNEYAKRHGMEPGGKTLLDYERYKEMTPLMMRGGLFTAPGGSSANVVTTLSRLMGDGVEVSFIGRVGNGPISEAIDYEMRDANINMIRPPIPDGLQLHGAVTYALLSEDERGERDKHNATYPGNVHEIIKPETADEQLVKNTDAVFMQGSLWQKFDPEFSNRLMKYRWDLQKELWLALPTKAEFGVDQQDFFQFLIPSANVVLGNMDELCRTAGLLGKKGNAAELSPGQRMQALQKLRDAFNRHFEDEDKMIRKDKQRAFITDGSNSAWVVTRDKIEEIHVNKMPDEQIRNKTGVGDTAFSGFLYGYLNGLDAEQSARIGVTLAREKLKEDDSRLPDPQKTLKDVLPYLYGAVQGEQPVILRG